MRRDAIAPTVAALATAGAIMAINANDHAQDPATDVADAVATFAALGGAAIWFALRWADTSRPSIRTVRSVAAAIAIAAFVIGLASVVYDPWAD